MLSRLNRRRSIIYQFEFQAKSSANESRVVQASAIRPSVVQITFKTTKQGKPAKR